MLTTNNLARALIGIVLLINVQSAIAILYSPSIHAANFELQGEIGVAMMRGIAVLFLMWNVPYAFALWDPFRHTISLIEAILMQLIGLAGEIYILYDLSVIHVLSRSAILRFIIFDAAGLLLLILAYWIVRAKQKSKSIAAVV